MVVHSYHVSRTAEVLRARPLQRILPFHDQWATMRSRMLTGS